MDATLFGIASLLPCVRPCGEYIPEVGSVDQGTGDPECRSRFQPLSQLAFRCTKYRAAQKCSKCLLDAEHSSKHLRKWVLRLSMTRDASLGSGVDLFKQELDKKQRNQLWYDDR